MTYSIFNNWTSLCFTGTSQEEGVGICHSVCEYLLKFKVFYTTWNSALLMNANFFYTFILGIIVWIHVHGFTFQSKIIILNIILFQYFRHLSSLPPISWTLAIWRICIQMYKSKIKPSRLKVHCNRFGLFNSC